MILLVHRHKIPCFCFFFVTFLMIFFFFFFFLLLIDNELKNQDQNFDCVIHTRNNQDLKVEYE